MQRALKALSLLVQKLTLRTKLLFMMLSLLVLSVSSLFFLHLINEQLLVSQILNYTDELTTAIEIAQEQPAREGDPQVVLNAFAEKLRKLGVKEVSLTDEAEEVQASTNPGNIGKKLVRRSSGGRREYVIRGVLGEEVKSSVSQKTSTYRIPLVVGDRRVGYLVITRFLDDFSALSQSALVSRLAVTLGVFSIGLLFSLFLAWSFTRPLDNLTKAARQVSSGDLSVQVPLAGGEEIRCLSQTFNEMVERLREQRILEERLRAAERATSLGRLASAVAHEIRNPLNFVNLSIDHLRQRLLRNEAAPKDEFDRILRDVKSEVSRLNRLVGDFLNFGKPLRLNIVPVDLRVMLNQVSSLINPKARDQGVTMHVEIAEGIPLILLDPELIKSCLLNLMINALDAMPNGGTLSVSADFGVGEKEEYLHVAVTDTGEGMSPETLESAFEPYFSTKDAGFGLGLAMTQKIVQDHAGTISLQSEIGVGTRAEIRLPLAMRVEGGVKREPMRL